MIRETLELIEDQIRFRTVRIFSTYAAIASFALTDEGVAFDPEAFEAVPLYLELGASDRTMISLMDLGLSRGAAARLAVLAGRQRRNMERPEAIAWLLAQDFSGVPLSLAMRTEIGHAVERGKAAADEV